MLIAIIPSLLMGFISYSNASRSFREEIGEKNEMYLKQTTNAFEIIFKQIQDSIRQVVLNQSFQNFESYPNGIYYENLFGALKDEDLQAMYGYLRNKQEAAEWATICLPTSQALRRRA